MFHIDEILNQPMAVPKWPTSDRPMGPTGPEAGGRGRGIDARGEPSHPPLSRLAHEGWVSNGNGESATRTENGP